MTAPVQLPLYGMVKLRETTKEALLEFWQDVEKKTGIEIQYQRTREEHLARGGWLRRRELARQVPDPVRVARHRASGHPAKARRAGRGRLEGRLPAHRSRSVSQGQRVLVVGGGDSALEAATSLAEEPGTQVQLAYRSDGFSRAKPKNRDKLEAAVEEHGLRVLLKSQVREIAPAHVDVETPDGVATHRE